MEGVWLGGEGMGFGCVGVLEGCDGCVDGVFVCRWHCLGAENRFWVGSCAGAYMFLEFVHACIEGSSAALEIRVESQEAL